MKFWMIVNIENRVDAPVNHADEIIPRTCAPVYMHACQEDAEKELLRLSKTYIGDFWLMESVAHVSSVQTCAGIVYRVEQTK